MAAKSLLDVLKIVLLLLVVSILMVWLGGIGVVGWLMEY